MCSLVTFFAYAIVHAYATSSVNQIDTIDMLIIMYQKRAETVKRENEATKRKSDIMLDMYAVASMQRTYITGVVNCTITRARKSFDV